jgi:aminoglycoside 3-N-acetyltransferase
MTVNKNVYQELVDSFELKKDDTLFISSDISNLAKNFKERGVAFDVNSFIVELQQKVKEGTIIIPAYTDNLRNGDIFDYQKSKPTTGALSNRVGKRKDFARSFDPLHSAYVWGKWKTVILNLSDESAFGENSIFGLLAKENAKFIFIDVDLQNSFTFIHYLEQKRNVAYRKFYPVEIQIKNNNIVAPKLIQFHTKRMGISTNLFPLQTYLLENKYVKEKIFGQSRIYLSNADEMTKGVNDCLQKGIKLYKFDAVLLAKQFVKKMIGKKYF